MRLKELGMPRKSTRTASARYRRSHLTWVDLDSSGINRKHCNSTSVPKASNLTKTTSGRCVTPSPRITPTSKIAPPKRPLPKRSARRKLIFTAKKNSKATTYRPASYKSEKLSTSVQKRLFTRNFDTDISSATRDANKNFTRRTVPKSKYLSAASKALNLGRNRKGIYSSGDSLALLTPVKKTIPSAMNTTVCIRNDELDCPKRFRRYSTCSKKEVFVNNGRNTIPKHKPSVSRKTRMSQVADVGITEKSCSRPFVKDNTVIVTKSKKPFSEELVSLLTSRVERNNKKTRTRSVTEILDEIKKESKSTYFKRACLPRACKNTKKGRFREVLTDEDTDGEREQENTNTDGDDSKTNSTSKMNNIPRDENETTEGCLSAISCPTNTALLGTNKLPLPKVLKTERSASLWSSSLIEMQSISSSLILKNEQHCDSRDGNTVGQTEKDILSTKGNQSKFNLTLPFKGDKDIDPSVMIHCERAHETQTNFYEQPKHAEQKQRCDRFCFANGFHSPTRHISKTIVSENVSALQDSTQESSKLIQQSSHQHPQQEKQFFIEEYAPNSSSSNNDNPLNQSMVQAEIPYPRSTTTEDISIKARGPLSLKSNNLSTSTRATQEPKSQFFSNPPTTITNEVEESQINEILNSSKTYHSSSLNIAKKQEQLESREHEKDVTTSQKRVRFDSATTTFSVKIKIKTNLDSDRQNKNRSEYNQIVPITTALNDSAMKAIASQVTQACLTQARTNVGIGDSRDPKVNLNLNINEGEFSSQTSDRSSNSDQNSKNSGDQKRNHGSIHDLLYEKDSYIVGTKGENGYGARKDLDDGRSITSELTNDWNRPKHSGLNDRDYLLARKEENEADSASKDQSISVNFMQKAKKKTHQDIHVTNGNEKSRFIEQNKHQKEEIMSHKRTHSCGIPKAHRYGISRSDLSLSRRQRIWSCNDSLAGSQYGSMASVVVGEDSSIMPKEDSLYKCSKRVTGISASLGNDVDKIDYASTKSDEIERTKVEGISSTPITVTPSRKPSHTSLLPTYRCGECKGCRRIFDCQTCQVCLEKLHFYGSTQLQSTDEGVSVCLLRRCQRTCRVGFVDSLLDLNSSCDHHESKKQVDNKSELNNALLQDKSSHRESVKNSISKKKNAVEDFKDFTSKVTKVPWDDRDDWTVDYSYLCEPEYLRHWENSGSSNEGMKKLSSTNDLSSIPLRLPVNENQKITGVDSGGRASLSSISELVASRKILKQTMASYHATNVKHGKGRRRNGKRKRDPLHGLALPSISTDLSYVTSSRANRNCLRALMEYDEADQDWV